MKMKIFCRLPAIAVLAIGTLAYAETVTDAALDVTYTATSTFTPVSGNTYDVFLTVDASSFSQGNGFLDAVEMQFKTGSDTATSVDLLAAPGGVTDWSLVKPGGLNSGGCDMNAASSGDDCFQFTETTDTTDTAVPGGPYDFEFAVTLPGTDALTADSDIKAAYNTATDNSGKNLGLTSMGITIGTDDGGGGGGGTGGTVPEPSTLVLLFTGAGLMGLARYRKQRV